MAQVLNVNPFQSSTRTESDDLRVGDRIRKQNVKQRWATLQQELKCNGKFTCHLSGSSREEQAKKALESALVGKKNEFEKWNKEIKKREEVGGGGDSGRGGWFGWGGRFGWFNDDNFWAEVQQASLAVLGIIFMYLVAAKGDKMFAVVFNPLVYALRGMRNQLTFISSRILGKTAPDGTVDFADSLQKEVQVHVSARERVIRKWGSD